MQHTRRKSFGPIRDADAFCQQHAAETEADIRAYLPHLLVVATGDQPIRMLDFGCGDGAFTAAWLDHAAWLPARLQLALVEPDDVYRHQAVARLQRLPATQNSAVIQPNMGMEIEIPIPVTTARGGPIAGATTLFTGPSYRVVADKSHRAGKLQGHSAPCIEIVMNHFDEHQAHAAQTLNARLDDIDDFLAAVDAATNHYAQETTFAQVAAQNAAIGTPMGTARINVNLGPRKDFGKGSVHFTVAASPAALEDWAYFVSAPNNTYNDQVRGRATEANVCATDVETIIKALPAYAQQGSPELVLRDLPETREKDGLVYMALQNEPRGLPKGVTLESGPLYLTSLVKQWRTPDGRKTRCS